MATVVEGDQKAPFSIATNRGAGEGATSFHGLLCFTLDTYLICWVLSKEVSSNIFKAFGMRLNPGLPNLLRTLYPLDQWSGEISTNTCILVNGSILFFLQNHHKRDLTKTFFVNIVNYNKYKELNFYSEHETIKSWKKFHDNNYFVRFSVSSQLQCSVYKCAVLKRVQSDIHMYFHNNNWLIPCLISLNMKVLSRKKSTDHKSP